MNHILLVRLIFLLSAVVIFGLLLKIFKSIRFERRIARYSLKGDMDEISYFDKVFLNYQKFVSKLENNKILYEYSYRYQKHRFVGENVNAVQFVIHKLVIACCFVLLIVIYATVRGRFVPFIFCLISFILGYYLYDIYLYFYQKRRKAKIKNDMLRAVIVMNNAFKVGKSTLQAVEIASKDLPLPIAYEFQKIAQDMSYGLSIDVAFSRFAKRIQLEEANYIASSLTILNKTGGNIVMVFSSIERTLFDKKKLEEDLKNSTAASNLVVKILMGIPVVLVIVIYVISPSYFEPFFASSLGYFILFIIWLMFVLYLYLLNKIMKVKV
jgi:tight adherence protein B